MPPTGPPELATLGNARATSAALLARVDAARNGAVTPEGGDVSAHGSGRLVTRHLANYVAAVDLSRRQPVAGAVVDVGSGVGAFGVWAAQELETQVHLVDRDPTARAVAARAFPHATVVAEPEEVPAGTARLVTAMEVIEHVPPREQHAFVRRLIGLVAPGGLLVMSTPDEAGYLGGWSGYGPHVGTLSHAELAALLGRSCRWPVGVWRLEGGPFELGWFRAVAEPVLNRAWGTLERRVPAASRLASRAAGGVARGARQAAGGVARRASPVAAVVASRSGAARRAASAASNSEGPSGRASTLEVRAAPASQGKGTGLLGVVQRPLD